MMTAGFGAAAMVSSSSSKRSGFRGTGLSPQAPAEVLPPKEPAKVPRRRARPSKPRIPEDLPTEEIVLMPPEVEEEPDAYKRIGEEVTQELDYIPPQYFRRLYIRGKYVPKADRSLPPIIAPLPLRLIPGGYAGVGLLVDTVLKKFIDHLPLYRQEQILKSRYGIELSRKTMSNWLEQVAWWLKPIYNHIADQIRRGCWLCWKNTCPEPGLPSGPTLSPGKWRTCSRRDSRVWRLHQRKMPRSRRWPNVISSCMAPPPN